MKSLAKKLVIASGLGLAGLGLSACTSSDLVKIGNSSPLIFMPRFLEPGVIRDAREIEQAKDAEYRTRQSQSGIMITTPQGYDVNLRESSEVRYNGKPHWINEINVPYVNLSKKVAVGYDTKSNFTIKISELDMMQE